MVEDPPEMVERRKRRDPVDFIGLGAVAIGVGLLEFTLDKGQEKDWFGSGEIQLTACSRRAPDLLHLLGVASSRPRSST